MAIEDDIYSEVKSLFEGLIDSHLREQRLAGEKMSISDISEIYGIVESILSSDSYNKYQEDIINDVLLLAEADDLVDNAINNLKAHPLPEYK